MAQSPDQPLPDPHLAELMERGDEIRRTSTEVIRRMKELDGRIREPEGRRDKDSCRR